MNDIIDFIGTDGGGATSSIPASLRCGRRWRTNITDLHRRGCSATFLPPPSPSGACHRRLGCGVGTVATYLNRLGLCVDYADVHAEALRRARERAGEAARGRRFTRVDITRGLPPGNHRGVLLLDVLEHLPDDRAVLRAVHAALAGRPDAFVLFTVPAFRQLWSPWDDLEKHKRRYTLGEARALAAETGYTIERASYFFFPLFFAAAAVKGLRVARRAIAGPPPPPRFDHLPEAGTARR